MIKTHLNKSFSIQISIRFYGLFFFWQKFNLKVIYFSFFIEMFFCIKNWILFLIYYWICFTYNSGEIKEKFCRTESGYRMPLDWYVLDTCARCYNYMPATAFKDDMKFMWVYTTRHEKNTLKYKLDISLVIVFLKQNQQNRGFPLSFKINV